jgi:formylglycine-generating enzyme required for sulfatase activity
MIRAGLALAAALLATLPASGPGAPSMVRLPGGAFVHPGSQDGLVLHVDPFDIGRTPVTWAQYKRFALGTSHWTPLMAAHEAEFPPDAPIVFITWDDAEAFCESFGYRLPTELEWEYAAAGGARRLPYRYTPDEAKELRWYGGAKKEPHRVGQGSPNAYGLYDLHGNVWEWVADERGSYTRQDSRDPTGGTDNLGCGQLNTDDGSYAWFLRAAVRAASRKDQAMRFRGFRCAR